MYKTVHTNHNDSSYSSLIYTRPIASVFSQKMNKHGAALNSFRANELGVSRPQVWRFFVLISVQLWRFYNMLFSKT